MSLAAILLVPLVSLFIIGAIVNLLRAGAPLIRFVEVACWVAIVVSAVSCAAVVGQSLIGNQTTVQVPLAVHTPDVLLPGVTVVKPAATIVSGGADRATLTITGLGWASRIILSVSTITQAAVTIVVALVILRLARNLRAEKPFGGLAQPLLVCGGVIFSGALVWSVAESIGSYLAGQEALRIQGWASTSEVLGSWVPDSATALSYLGWPEPANWSVNLSFLPFGAACVLALLGLAFRSGERMQADTEGLV